MTPRVLLIDALGTLLALEPPAPKLRSLLRERFGVEVSERRAMEGFLAEITYYRAHLDEGRDATSVADLRRRCALVLRDALAVGPALEHADPDELTSMLLDALEFTAFDDVRPALAAVRATGLRVMVVSNWDASLPQTLARVGIGDLLDGVVSSAACGAAKPDPAPLREALRLAGAEPAQAVHVGDSLLEDVGGARAAGIAPVLLVRPAVARVAAGAGSGAGVPSGEGAGSGAGVPPEVAVIASLAELPALLAAADFGPVAIRFGAERVR